MIVPDSIVSLARQIPNPEHNFRGISGQLPGLPFQVLLFCRSPRTDVRPDFHYRFVWLYAIGGEGDVVIDGVANRLKAGQRLLIRPYAQHGYKAVSGQPPLECVFIAFEMNAAKGINGLHGEVQTCSFADIENLQRLLSDYLALRTHSVAHHGAHEILTSQCVLQVAAMLEMGLLTGEQAGRLAREELTSVNQQLVERVWAFARNASPAPIGSNTADSELPEGESAASITRRTLAKRLAVSESSLRDAIQNFAHTSPRDFVRRIRLQRAAIWLMEYGFPVSEVARNAGYGEAAAFSNEFKKLMGTRPSDLLKQYTRQIKHKPSKRRLHQDPPINHV